MTRSGILPPLSPRTQTGRVTRDLDTDGSWALAVARAHGRHPLPWQRDLALLAGARRADGRARWPVVVVTVPRQVGKTTTVLDILLGRCLARPGWRTAYTAQSGHQTTARMGDRMRELASGPLASRVRLRRSQGTERITVGSGFVRAFPPIADALRGDPLDTVAMDEAQAHGDALGHALDATVLPTMTTSRSPQLIITGTAGLIPGSEYLRRYLDAALADPAGDRVLLIDYGAAEGDNDADPDVWRRTHPGLASGLTSVEFLAEVRAVNPAAFRREFLNVWEHRANLDGVPLFAWHAWQALRDPSSELPTRTRPVFAVEVAPDRSAAAIAVAGRRSDGLTHVELVDAVDGVGWLPGRIEQLRKRWAGRIVVDAMGAAASLSGVPGIELVGAVEVARAHGRFLDMVTGGTLRHRGQTVLDASVSAATLRPMGDRQVIARRGAGDVTPVTAAALAAASVPAAPAARPVIITGAVPA